MRDWSLGQSGSDGAVGAEGDAYSSLAARDFAIPAGMRVARRGPRCVVLVFLRFAVVFVRCC